MALRGVPQMPAWLKSVAFIALLMVSALYPAMAVAQSEQANTTATAPATATTSGNNTSTSNVTAEAAGGVAAPGANTTSNTTEEVNETQQRMPGYGLVVALWHVYNNTERFLDRLGVPENHTLREELEAIASNITEVEDLVERGDLQNATKLAAQLFRELAMIIVEANREYRGRAADATLLREYRALRAQLRVYEKVLEVAERRLDRISDVLEEANCTVEVPLDIEEAKANLTALLGRVGELAEALEEAAKAFSAGNMSREEFADILRTTRSELESVKEEVKNTTLTARRAEVLAAACHLQKRAEIAIRGLERARQQLEQLVERLNATGNVPPFVVEKLREKIREINETIERLQNAITKIESGNFTVWDLSRLSRALHRIPNVEKLFRAYVKKMEKVERRIQARHELQTMMSGVRASVAMIQNALPLLPEDLRSMAESLLESLRALGEALRNSSAPLEDLEAAIEEVKQKLEELKEALDEAELRGPARMLERALDALEKALERVKERVEMLAEHEGEEEAEARADYTALLDAAARRLEAARQLAERLNATEIASMIDEAMTLVEQAKQHIEAGNHSEALQAIDQAASLLKSAKELADELDSYHRMADALEDMLDDAKDILEDLAEAISETS